MLQGFKTIIFNIVALIAAWLATNFGIELAPDEQAAIAVTLVTIGNIILRIFTKSAIFTKHDE